MTPWATSIGARPQALVKAEEARRIRLKRERFQRLIERNPILPLVIRLTTFGFSSIALGIAIAICAGHDTSFCSGLSIAREGSPILAVITTSFALPYLVNITMDEYTSGPIGLRSARSKAKVIFSDLAFIMLNSLNVMWAFEAAFEPAFAKSGCTPSDYDWNLRRALFSALLVALLAWLTTYSVTMLRYVCSILQLYLASFTTNRFRILVVLGFYVHAGPVLLLRSH